MQQPQCDFCGAALVFGSSWRFACDDFSITKPDGGVQEYAEDWSACPPCKDLIVAGERDELAQRAARSVIQSAPVGVPFEFAVQSAREIQDGFWSNRSGSPRLDTKEEFEAPIRRGGYRSR